MAIEKYIHHGVFVSVQSHLKGRHAEHCLCYQECRFFKPAQDDNCKIAALLYRLDILCEVTTPVWECEKYATD